MHLLFQYSRKVTDEGLKKAKGKAADVSIMLHTILYYMYCIVLITVLVTDVHKLKFLQCMHSYSAKTNLL